MTFVLNFKHFSICNKEKEKLNMFYCLRKNQNSNFIAMIFKKKTKQNKFKICSMLLFLILNYISNYINNVYIIELYCLMRFAFGRHTKI